jgi:tripartite-type tricarboxylate transporter receptor subunit TctC
MLDASSFASNPSLFAKLPYQPATAFVPVSVLAVYPNVLVVHPAFAPRTVAELISAARAKPGSISYASSGNGSAQHLAAELFAQRAGVDMVHVPYKGGGPAMTDVMGGQVPVFFANIASGLGNIRSGKLRPLALTGAGRVAALPDVPTMAQAGVADYEVYEWNAVFVPAGTPADVVATLSAAIGKVMAQPEIRERVASLGGELKAGSPRDAADFIRQQTELWARVIRAGNIKPD